MAGRGSEGPVADFCAALRRLQQRSGISPAALASRLGYRKSQMYEILDGRISRPPEWDRVVEPLVRVCAPDDKSAVAYWRRRHSELVEVYDELRRRGQPDGPPTAKSAVGGPPAQLPADVDTFTGRTWELAELQRMSARTTGQTDTAVAISVVSGTAGVGKTALALRWAHRVRDEFPDGQLYVNLRGYDLDQPLSAGDALAGFLRALGLAGPDIPLEPDERAACYRSLLTGRRMLVVLDNATDVEQVRPLLPGTRSCAVLVTSRDSLAGLVAREGARRLDLDLLPPQDAVGLLGALIGERVDAEPDAAAVLASQCARLPLALRVAAELAATRPATSLAGLVTELADEQRRLELLDAGGDGRTAVRGVFSWSYRHLPAEAAVAFRRLGSHPGPDLDTYAAAALIDTSLPRTQHLLDVLSRGHLISNTSPGRYGIHDLLRAYAVDLGTIEDHEQARRTASTRLFDHYVATAAAAMNTLYPAERHRRPPVPTPATPTPATPTPAVPTPGTPSPPVAEPDAARAWLDTERATLTAVCAYTAAHGWAGHTVRMAAILFRHLDVGGHYLDALTIHTHARHAAAHTGDRSAEASALTNLGTVYWQQCRYDQAIDHFQQALALAREIGDQLGEGRALGNLGQVHLQQGRYQQAAEHQQQAVALFHEIGDRAGEVIALVNLGLVHVRQGCWQQAAEHFQQTLTLAREIGDQAIEAHALTNLGNVHRQQGRYQQAADHQQQALTLATQIGDRGAEAEALNGLGETLRSIGELCEACIRHTAALTLATQIGDRYEQARAHDGLANAHHTADDPDQARQHWCEALARYRDLGVPEADTVQAHLTELNSVRKDQA
ncbi:MAG: ATP-binding protein [Pseudonocardiales bacterium]